MRSSSRPAPTSTPRRAFLTLFAIASALATSSCVTPASNVDRDAEPPTLEIPERARQTCRVTATPVETLADLEARDRWRGIEVRECDGMRALAVATKDEEARLRAEFYRQREARNRSLLERLTPWAED